MPIEKYKDDYDRDRDGVISHQEIEHVRSIVEIEVKKERASTQRRMAWTSMCAMVFFTLMLFTPLISDARVDALSDLIGLFFIAQAGIVGAYMGVTAWITNSSSTQRKPSSYQQYSSKRDLSDGD
jgi:hypothetical protein